MASIGNQPYSLLDFLQNTGDAIGYMAASFDNTSNFSRVADLAGSAFKVINSEKDLNYAENIINNLETSSKVCKFIQFFDFFNYFISGQLIKDARGGVQSVVSLFGRIAFFGADASGAVKMGAEVIGLFAKTLSLEIIQNLVIAANVFSVAGFSCNLISTIKEYIEINNGAADAKTKERIIKVALEFSDALIGLAAAVTSIACTALGIVTTFVPALLGASAAIGLAKAAYSAYYEKHNQEKGLAPAQNQSLAQKASNVVNNIAQNSDSLNQATKLINGMVGAYDCYQKGFADIPAVSEINITCKQYSGDLGFVSVAKRISEAVTSNERGTYDWADSKNALKTTKMSCVFVANCMEAANYLRDNVNFNLGKINDNVIGDLRGLSLAKSVFVALSIFFGLTDSSVKIDKARHSEKSRDFKLHIWKDMQNQMNNEVATPGTGQASIVDLSYSLQAALFANGPLNANEPVGNVAIAAIIKHLNKLGVARANEIHLETNGKTRAIRVAAAKRRQALEDQILGIGNLDPNAANDLKRFVDYKVERFEAKKYNNGLSISKNAFAIINDLAKAAIVGLTTAGSAMQLKDNNRYKASVALVGLAAGLIAFIKTIYDSCNQPRKLPVFA